MPAWVEMHIHIRSILFGKAQYAKVRNDKGIHPGFGRVLDILRQLGKLIVGGQVVQGQVYFFAASMGKNAAIMKLANGQVDRCGAHTKARQCAVYGIGTIHDGIFQGFKAAGR